MINEVMLNPRTGKPWTASARDRHWVSNGNGYDANEHKMLGERVVFVAGGRIQAIGMLKMVRASTRGNTTLAVVYKQRREDGKVLKRECCIWEHRNKAGEFSIERVDESQPEQAEWIERKNIVLPGPASTTGSDQ